MVKAFQKLTYEVKEFPFNENDFGVLQNRKELFLLVIKENWIYRYQDFIPKNIKQYTVQSVFGRFTKVKAGEEVINSVSTQNLPMIT